MATIKQMKKARALSNPLDRRASTVPDDLHAISLIQRQGEKTISFPKYPFLGWGTFGRARGTKEKPKTAG